MKIAIKGAIILLVASLVVMAVGCEEEEGVIKIGVIGPMTYIQGEHHWYGATLAAEEINAAGGIMVGDESYEIKLVKADSNEIMSPADAATAMERLITVENVDFVLGGFRTEAVFAMQEVAMDYKTIFLGAGAATPQLNTPRVTDNYERYKYWFRITPINSNDLNKVSSMVLGMVAGKIGAELLVAPKVAILAEEAIWADLIVAGALVALPLAGIEVVGTWRPSPTATSVTPELTAIAGTEANIILAILSGPVGIPYARQWGELEIPAASVGINVEAQKDGFWEATGGYGDYMVTLNTLARVEITDETAPFIERFEARWGEFPIYTAGTYDAIYVLKEAIERADSLDSDDVVTALEDTDYTGAAGRIMLDESHDVIWGPGYVTGICTQWQEGELKAIWPVEVAPPAGIGITYEGVVDYVLPPWMTE